MARKIASTLMIVGIIAAALMLPFAGIERSNRPPSIDQALFFPVKYPEGDWHPQRFEFEDVYFRSRDNTQLHGWFCPVKGNRGVVLLIHGNSGNVTTRIQMLRELQSTLRLSVFVFDYRGFGRSKGKPTVQDAYQDAFAAHAKLRELANVEGHEIILMGESLGGAYAIKLAVQFPPRALVLQSTFSSLRDLAEIHYPQYAALVSPRTLDSTNTISDYSGPLFQSHGENDRVIPIALGREVFAAAGGDSQTFFSVPEAGHNDWLSDEYWQTLDEFLRESPADEN